MSNGFDAYHKWLSIPPHEQPPNHYRLLGLGLFESDADVIAAAADRQMAHVQTYKTGPHSALSQQLLNEISAAKLCLLRPQKRLPYDEQLREQLGVDAGGFKSPTSGAHASGSAPPITPPGGIPAMAGGRLKNPAPFASGSIAPPPPALPPPVADEPRKSMAMVAVLVGAGVCAVALIIGIVIVLGQHGGKADSSTANNPASAVDSTAGSGGTNSEPLATSDGPATTTTHDVTTHDVSHDAASHNTALPSPPKATSLNNPPSTVEANQGTPTPPKRIGSEVKPPAAQPPIATTVKPSDVGTNPPQASDPARHSPASSQPTVVSTVPSHGAPTSAPSVTTDPAIAHSSANPPTPSIPNTPSVAKSTDPNPFADGPTKNPPVKPPVNPSLNPPVKPSLAGKAAIPDKEQIAAVEQRLGLAATTALPADLLTQAHKAEEAPDVYVLLRRALDSAIERGDAATAISAVDDLARGFAVDPMVVRTQTLDDLRAHVSTPEAWDALASAAAALADDASAASAPTDAVEHLTELSLMAARKSGNLDTIRKITLRILRARSGLPPVSASNASLQSTNASP